MSKAMTYRIEYSRGPFAGPVRIDVAFGRADADKRLRAAADWLRRLGCQVTGSPRAGYNIVGRHGAAIYLYAEREG